MSALPGFPSFADLKGKPYTVSYTKRAITINDEPALFLSGSLHPPRAPHQPSDHAPVVVNLSWDLEEEHDEISGDFTAD